MTEPRWVVEARRWIGTREAAGSANNPTIIGWAKKLGGWIAGYYKADSTPWCALWVNYVMQGCGIKGTGSLAALSFRDWGTSLPGTAVGAVATKTRKGGGHVFIVLGRDKAGRVVGIGGNQSDAVTIASYPLDELRFNWPPGEPLPAKVGFTWLPLMNSAGRPTSEA